MTNKNHLSLPGKYSRREFLRRSAAVAGAGFAAPWAFDLASFASAATDDADDDYRALVCVFLYGGNDAYNTMIPNDAGSHAAYLAARGSIARPLESVLTLDPIGGFTGAGTFGMASELAGLKGLFDAGDLAVLPNIGTLVRPIDKAGYQFGYNRPPQLFSHNDQQSFWQASSPEGATTGWGGRMSDLLLDGNGSSSTFTCISVAGNAVMMSGREALQFHVAPTGVTQLRTDTFEYDPALEGVREMMELAGDGLFSSSYATIGRRALDSAAELSGAIDAADAAYDLDPHFDTTSTNTAQNGLAAQLKMVSRLIAAGRDSLGTKRQVFFVAMGGFDTHDELATTHPNLLSALDVALSGFHEATKVLDAVDDVVTFTGSDFGRSLASNGDGSDHGWGGHQFVMGGSVLGKRVYGDVPEVADNGPDDVGGGRLLPTTSVDQFAATLATWMGAGASELAAVVPNISNYDVVDLGFLPIDVEPEPPVVPPVVEPESSGDGIWTPTSSGTNGLAQADRMSMD